MCPACQNTFDNHNNKTVCRLRLVAWLHYNTAWSLWVALGAARAYRSWGPNGLESMRLFLLRKAAKTTAPHATQGVFGVCMEDTPLLHVSAAQDFLLQAGQA